MLEKTLESPLDIKKTKSVNPKGNQPWIFIGRADSLEKTLMLGKIWRQEEKGVQWDGWDGSVVSLNPWTWIWANSRKEWRTRQAGVLQFMGSQRVRHDWVTEKHHHLWEEWGDVVGRGPRAHVGRICCLFTQFYGPNLRGFQSTQWQ